MDEFPSETSKSISETHSEIEISSLIEPTPIGEILMRRGQIRKFQLDFLLELQRAYKKICKNWKIGELLLIHRALTPLALTEALAVQEEMPKESVTEILRMLENSTQKTRLIPETH